MLKWVEWWAEGVKAGYFQVAAQAADGYNSGDINNGLIASYVGSSAGMPYLTVSNLTVTRVPAMAYDGTSKEAGVIWTRGAIGFNKGDGKAGGVEVLVCNTTGHKQEYAKRICASISKLGYNNRGVKVNNKLGYLTKVMNQCVLIECCFVDDADDIKKYNYKTMAKAIVEGILNKSITTTSTTQSTKQTYYQVVCGSFQSKSNAKDMKARLEKAGFTGVFLEATTK